MTKAVPLEQTARADIDSLLDRPHPRRNQNSNIRFPSREVPKACIRHGIS